MPFEIEERIRNRRGCGEKIVKARDSFTILEYVWQCTSSQDGCIESNRNRISIRDQTLEEVCEIMTGNVASRSKYVK